MAKLDELNRQRVLDLRTSGEVLREAQAIRLLVEEVRGAVVSENEIDPADLDAWMK